MSKGLILCATRFEMADFLDRTGSCVQQKTPSGLSIFSGTLDQVPFDCMITGPGVFNTAHGLTVYLEHKRPKLILDTGIAGGFSSFRSGGNNSFGSDAFGSDAVGGMEIGDIGIAEQEQYIHTGVGVKTLSPLPFDLMENHPLTRRGIYCVDPDLVELYHGLLTREFAGSDKTGHNKTDHNKIGHNKIVRGNFITVSSITASRGQARTIFDQFSCAMENMEGAAALHVAALYGVPIIEIRAVSNFAGDRDKGRWDFPLACERVGQICKVVIANGFKTKID
jgi:futalosine hydrolase